MFPPLQVSQSEARRLKAANMELQDELERLQHSRAAYKSQAAHRAASSKAVFDPLCTTVWPSTGTGRKAKSKARADFRGALAAACSEEAPRPLRAMRSGPGEEAVQVDGGKRASVAKRLVLAWDVVKDVLGGQPSLEDLVDLHPDARLRKDGAALLSMGRTMVRRVGVLNRRRDETERNHLEIVLASSCEDGPHAKAVAGLLGQRHRTHDGRETPFRRAVRNGAAFDEAVFVEADTPWKVGDEAICRGCECTIESLEDQFDVETGEFLATHVSVRFAHGDAPHVFKGGAGSGKKGARLRRRPARLAVLTLAKKNGGTPPEVISDIREFLCAVCPTSPDQGRRGRAFRFHGPRQKETARKMFRFETWDELWAAFKLTYPASAAKIALSGDPDKCPPAFMRNAPWFLQKGGGESCICQSCENVQKMAGARRDTAAFLAEIVKEYLAEDDDDAVAVEAAEAEAEVAAQVAADEGLVAAEDGEAGPEAAGAAKKTKLSNGATVPVDEAAALAVGGAAAKRKAVLAPTDDVGLGLWLGLTMPMDEWGGSCTRVVDAAMLNGRKWMKAFGVRCDPGNVLVAVQWYELCGDNGMGADYELARVIITNVVNSSELRLAGFEMEQTAGPRLVNSRDRRAGQALEFAEIKAAQKWLLSAETKLRAEGACRSA